MRVTFIRHCEAEHNVGYRYYLHDPPLTVAGTAHAQRIIGPSCDIVLCSPLRRALQTATAIYNSNTSRPPIVALPELQEVSLSPCDTGSAKKILEEEFGGTVDLSRLDDGVWPTKSGLYGVDRQTILKRAQVVRDMIMEWQRTKKIVVVSHGGILHEVLGAEEMVVDMEYGDARHYHVCEKQFVQNRGGSRL